MKLLILVLSMFAINSWSAEEAIKGLDREEIRRIIRDHLREVRACYDLALKVDKNLTGKVVMEWDIGAGGKVTRVSTVKSLHPQVDKCLEEKIVTWKFPEPAAGQIANIRYPFSFSTQ